MTGRALFAVLLLAGSVSAQLENQAMGRRIVVRVVVPSGSTCDSTIQVTMIGRGGPTASGSPKSDCTVEFANVPVGTYHLAVSGLHVTPVDTGSIPIDSSGPGEFEVKVARTGDPIAGDSVPSAPLVGVAELNIPRDAKRKFDKANSLMGKQDWSKAIQELNQAIAIYPSYADAYNNLGVVYARMGDRSKENDALQKALSINDHFAPAYANLGRMNIVAGNFSAAEAALNKAHAFDPNDAMTMVLLAYAEFMDQHLDEAIATSRQAHSLPQGPHAFVHQVAARAFEQKHDATNARSELQLFLKEEPAGPRADLARKELATVQSTKASSPNATPH